MNKIEIKNETNIILSIVIGRKFNECLADQLKEMSPSSNIVNEILYLVVDNVDSKDKLSVSSAYYYSSTDIRGYGSRTLQNIIIDNDMPHETYLFMNFIDRIYEALDSIYKKINDSDIWFDMEPEESQSPVFRAIIYLSKLYTGCQIINIDKYKTRLYSTKMTKNCYKYRKINSANVFIYDTTCGMTALDAKILLDTPQENFPINIEGYGFFVPTNDTTGCKSNYVFYRGEIVGSVIDLFESRFMLIKITALPRSESRVDLFINKISHIEYKNGCLNICLKGENLETDTLPKQPETTITDKFTEDVINTACILVHMNEIMLQSLEEKMVEINKEIARIKEVTTDLKKKLPDKPVFTNSFGVYSVWEPLTQEELQDLVSL